MTIIEAEKFFSDFGVKIGPKKDPNDPYPTIVHLRTIPGHKMNGLMVRILEKHFEAPEPHLVVNIHFHKAKRLIHLSELIGMEVA